MIIIIKKKTRTKTLLFRDYIHGQIIKQNLKKIYFEIFSNRTGFVIIHKIKNDEKRLQICILMITILYIIYNRRTESLVKLKTYT